MDVKMPHYGKSKFDPLYLAHFNVVYTKMQLARRGFRDTHLLFPSSLNLVPAAGTQSIRNILKTYRNIHSANKLTTIIHKMKKVKRKISRNYRYKYKLMKIISGSKFQTIRVRLISVFCRILNIIEPIFSDVYLNLLTENEIRLIRKEMHFFLANEYRKLLLFILLIFVQNNNPAIKYNRISKDYSTFCKNTYEIYKLIRRACYNTEYTNTFNIFNFLFSSGVSKRKATLSTSATQVLDSLLQHTGISKLIIEVRNIRLPFIHPNKLAYLKNLVVFSKCTTTKHVNVAKNTIFKPKKSRMNVVSTRRSMFSSMNRLKYLKNKRYRFHKIKHLILNGHTYYLYHKPTIFKSNVSLNFRLGHKKRKYKLLNLYSLFLNKINKQPNYKFNLQRQLNFQKHFRRQLLKQYKSLGNNVISGKKFFNKFDWYQRYRIFQYKQATAYLQDLRYSGAKRMSQFIRIRKPFGFHTKLDPKILWYLYMNNKPIGHKYISAAVKLLQPRHILRSNKLKYTSSEKIVRPMHFTNRIQPVNSKKTALLSGSGNNMVFNIERVLKKKRQFIQIQSNYHIRNRLKAIFTRRRLSFFCAKYQRRNKFNFSSFDTLSKYSYMCDLDRYNYLSKYISTFKSRYLLSIDFLFFYHYFFSKIKFIVFGVTFSNSYLSQVFVYLCVQFLLFLIIILYYNRGYDFKNNINIKNKISKVRQFSMPIFWHMIFKNVFFHYFINKFMKSGKREKMESTFLSILVTLKRRIRMQPMFFILKLFNSLLPVFDVYYLRRYRKMYPVPRLLHLRRRLLILFSIIKQILNEKKKIWYFKNRFVVELIRSNFKRSSIFSKIIQFQRFVYASRRNLYFTKKVKRKIKVFI